MTSDPAVRGGSPVIAGTTLRISDLAAYHAIAGLTLDQLSGQFDLDLSQVPAALSYFSHHKTEIDTEIRSNADQAEVWRHRLLDQGRTLGE